MEYLWCRTQGYRARERQLFAILSTFFSYFSTFFFHIFVFIFVWATNQNEFISLLLCLVDAISVLLLCATRSIKASFRAISQRSSSLQDLLLLQPRSCAFCISHGTVMGTDCGCCCYCCWLL